MEFKLLTEEQIKEIEEREQQKLIQQELKRQQAREVELRRKEQEQKALERLREQQRQNAEPLYSMVAHLKENEYLIMQYQNPNGRVSTYKFKSPSMTRFGDFYIMFTEDFQPYVTNGQTQNQILFQNILGLGIKEEMIADVIVVDGVKYKRLVIDEPVDTVISGQIKTYKGEYR